MIVAEDLGTAVRLNSGLSATDLVLDNPPDSIGNGDVVRVAAPVPGQAAARTAEK